MSEIGYVDVNTATSNERGTVQHRAIRRYDTDDGQEVTLRVHIKRDHSIEQSWGKVDVWAAAGWAGIESLPASELPPFDASFDECAQFLFDIGIEVAW